MPNIDLARSKKQILELKTEADELETTEGIIVSATIDWLLDSKCDSPLDIETDEDEFDGDEDEDEDEEDEFAEGDDIEEETVDGDKEVITK